MRIRVESPVATIRVDCEPEDAKLAVDLAKQLLSEALPVVERLGVANANFRWGVAATPSLTHASADEAIAIAADASNDKSDVKPEKRKRSNAGGAKTTSWQIVDLGLSETQLQGVKDAFAEKQPKGQNQNVAVLAWKLKELLGRDTFDGPEVHTALGIVDCPTPGNLTAVFGNMKTAKMCDVKDRKLVVNFLTDNFVRHRLPAKAAPSA
jgi:hypothetical protein